jgi:tetratricopeptide (TPR) repeat protein
MNNDVQTRAKGPNLTKHLGDLLKIFGSAVGASSLGVTTIYTMGFVVVNTSLLRHGAYELSLLRTEFLAAGISYSVLTLAMTLLGAVAVDWLVARGEPLLTWRPITRLRETVKVSFRTTSLLVTLLGGAIILLVMRYVAGLFPTGVQLWQRFGRAVIWGYMVALVGGIYVEYLDRKGFWRKLTEPAPELPEVGKAILWGVSLLLVALVSYGGYAYPHLPKSWGGGSPIYVEFVVEEEAKPMLETLGLKVGDQGLTERVEFLTESDERIFVVTQRGDTLSFSPSLVKASKFYDVNYYVSAEVHLSRGDWYRGERQWSNAINEYNAALLIQADLLDARIGRGMAHTEKYLESVRKESPDLQAYRSADSDLTEAILQAQAKGQDDVARTALAYYQRGRLRFHHTEYKDKAPQDLAEAIRLDSSFLRTAMLEEAFRDSTLNDQKFRNSAYNMKDGELANQYGALGNTLATDEAEKAAYAYDMAARVAEMATDLPDNKELSGYFHNLRAQVLESLSRNEEALEEWRQAIEADQSNWMYYYQFALLSYKRGLLDEVKDKCETVIARQEKDPATIGCKILIGNVQRDEEDPLKAIEDYDWAIKEAVAQGFPSFAAGAHYQWARLEARRGGSEQAIPLLEKAVWLDRSLSEKAALEGNFDVLRESAGYQKAIAPPVIAKISSDADKRMISFLLQAPADDFPTRVAVLTEISGQAALTKPDGSGQAASFEVSEDQLLYTFHLKQDASYNAAELASALRKLLGLAE